MIDSGYDLMEVARISLASFGISLEIEGDTDDGGAVGLAVTLARGGQRRRYAAKVTEHMTLSSVARGGHGPAVRASRPLLVIGDRINRRSAAALRNAGIQFVDSLGNASIAFGSVFVEVQGRGEARTQASGPRQPVARRQSSANLFSARRSQIILVLLTWPGLASARVREVADAAGVSVGQAHDALAQLQQVGFLIPVSRRLDRTEELLDLWTAAYPSGLGQRLNLASYHGDPAQPVRTAPGEQHVHLSGESAQGSGIVRPATLTVYVEHADRRLPIVNRWNAGPDRDPNIFVRKKFWTPPAIDGEQSTSEEQNAPWPLVYADLMATNDPRLHEVARNWRAHHARPGDM